MTELEAWKRTRQLLVDYGWCQKALRWYGAFCLLGACNQVRSGHYDTVGSPPMRLTVPGKWLNPPQWNDAPERTFSDVLAAIDARIAELEAQG